MRVIARQNIWYRGEAYPAGSYVELSDELASQLISDGLVEFAGAVKPAEPQERAFVVADESEPPKKQTRKRKK